MKIALTKLEAAERQIRTAIDLYFLHGDLISVMTLAGAAEEICGNILKRQGKKNILGVMYEEASKQGLAITEQEIYNRASKLRNAIKHATAQEEDNFYFDEEASVLMLVRAVVNFQLCGQPLPQELEKFIIWVRTNGLLIADKV